jgi:hypothetical protein
LLKRNHDIKCFIQNVANKILTITIFFFFLKVVSFTLYAKDSRKKTYLFDRTSFYIYEFHWNIKKCTENKVNFYYISINFDWVLKIVFATIIHLFVFIFCDSVLRILFFVLIFILIITSVLKVFSLTLYMRMMIERKNIYLIGILSILMNFIGTINFLLD